MKRSAVLLWVSCVTFVTLVVVSMAQYPGGSWLVRRATSHDFWRNFLCDLLGPTAINGQPNDVSSLAMKLAMAALLPALAVLWWRLPELFKNHRRLGFAVRLFGALSMVGMAAVPLTPPTASYERHAAAIFSGGVPSFIAWLLALSALLQVKQQRRLALVGGVALATVAVAFCLYAREFFFGGTPNVALPASHRVASLVLLSWLVHVGLAFWRHDMRVTREANS